MVLPAQVTIHVRDATDTAIREACFAANRYAFSTSPSNPVIVRFDAALNGRTIRLLNALPLVSVDHLVIELAGAGPADRVVLDTADALGSLRLSSHQAVVRNITFLDAGRNQRQVGDGVIVSGSADVRFERCTFAGSFAVGLWLDGCERFGIVECTFEGNGSAGLLCDNGTRDIEVRDCLFRNQGDAGITLIGGERTVVRGCTFDANVYGLLAGAVSRSLTFGPGNLVRASSGAGAVIDGAINPYVHANRFEHNGAPGLAVGEHTVGARIDDNLLLANGGNGRQTQLLLREVTATSCAGNTVQGGHGGGVMLIQCRDIVLTASGTNRTRITGNGFEALTVSACTNVAAFGLDVRGNQASGSRGPQMQVVDSHGCIVEGTTVAGGPGLTGLSFARTHAVTIGDGSVIEGHGEVGVLATDGSDIVIGFRRGRPGAGVSLRGNGTAVQLVGCTDSRVTGDPNVGPAASLLESNGVASGPSLRLIGCAVCGIGPGVTVDARQAAGIGIQLDSACRNVLLAGTTLRGHRDVGIVLLEGSGLAVRGCSVDGASGVARGPGVRIDRCAGVTLLANEVRGHGGDGISIDSSPGVLVGAGNRLLDNGADGCLAQNSRRLVPPPPVVLESVCAVGQQNSSQSGFRLLDVSATATNVTATRCAFGLLLQGQTNATVVNSILHGNGVADRAKTSSSTGRMTFSLYGTGSGNGWTGGDNLVSTAANYPRFVNAAGGDVRLQAGSPAIDSGTHATPAGSSLPCADSEREPRVRGGRVDRGSSEFNPGTGHGNSLELAGSWLRGPGDGTLAFALDAGGAHAGQPFVLLMTGSGTGPGVPLPGGSLPLVPDLWTAILLASPQTCTGSLDGQGHATLIIPVPAPVLPLLPERSTFAFTVGPAFSFVSNPVMARFLL
jgi:hypothetical protein